MISGTKSSEELKKDEEKAKNIRESVLQIKVKPTLVASTCGLPDGGCHSFGDIFSIATNQSYSKVQIGLLGVLGLPCDVSIIEERFHYPQKYKILCITGCLYRDVINVTSELYTRYDFSELEKIICMAPPHFFPPGPTEDKRFRVGNRIVTAQYITTNISIKHVTNIGMPNPTLQDTAEYKGHYKQANGLMYINSFGVRTPFSSSFLAAFFKKISQMSSNGPVLVIAANYLEKQLIQFHARKMKVNVIFSDKLPKHEFQSALKNIGNKSGWVAMNGAMTFIQATLHNCHPLFLFTNIANYIFLSQNYDSAPKELKPTVKSLLGLSPCEDYASLENKDNVDNAVRLLKKNFELSIQKFENNLKPAPTQSTAETKSSSGIETKETTQTLNSAEIREQLRQLTQVEWEYDEETNTAYTSSTSNEKIKATFQLMKQHELDVNRFSKIYKKYCFYKYESLHLSLVFNPAVLAKVRDAILMRATENLDRDSDEPRSWVHAKTA